MYRCWREIEKKNERRGLSKNLSYDSGNVGEDFSNNGMSIFAELLRPVFLVSNLDISSMPLSSYSLLDSNFILRIKDSFVILDESIKGYLQFSRTWKKDEQPLDFAPFEMAEDYYPEEIEEEVILPYNASSKFPSFQTIEKVSSSNLLRDAEVHRVYDILSHPAQDSFAHGLPKATSQKPAIDKVIARYEKTDPISSLKNRMPRQNDCTSEGESESSSKTKKRFTNKTIKDTGLQTRTPLRTSSKSKVIAPQNEESTIQNLGLREVIKPTGAFHEKSKSIGVAENAKNSKAFDHLNERAQSSSRSNQDKSLEKTLHDEDGKISSSDQPDRIENHELAKNQVMPKYAATSNRPPNSKDIVLPNLAKNGQRSENVKNTSEIISKTTIANKNNHFSSSDINIDNNRGRVLASSIEKSITVDEGKESSIFARAGGIDLERVNETVSNYKNQDVQDSRIISSNHGINRQTEKIFSTIDSLNLPHADDLEDADQGSLMQFPNQRIISKTQERKKPKFGRLVDTESITENSKFIAATEKGDSSVITINRLDVTVVGDSRDSARNGISLIETEDDPEESSHYASEYDHELLNKSYLWRYKIKF